MTPGARLSAAIELLDAFLAGEPVERALTRWSRASRFAGSKDRAAVRDVVFDGLRRRRSLGLLGGGDTGRGIVLGHAADQGLDLDAVFTGTGFDPQPLGPCERQGLSLDRTRLPHPMRLDYPDALHDELQASLGEDFEPVLAAMQARAPVDLRVNTLKTTVNAALVVLARDGIHAGAHPLAPTALRVLDNPRLVNASRAYTQGMVELQDVSSQVVSAAAGASAGWTVLDYCAGGGGKTLALAAAMDGQGRLFAYDIDARRMSDLPERARRAGAAVDLLDGEGLRRLARRCDLVFVDAPCSGTGAWRRKPEGKWRLAPADLDAFAPQQDAILADAAHHVKPGGLLVYATCSLLRRENEARAQAFAETHPAWQRLDERRLGPLEGGDGFYMVRFRASRTVPRSRP